MSETEGESLNTRDLLSSGLDEMEQDKAVEGLAEATPDEVPSSDDDKPSDEGSGPVREREKRLSTPEGRPRDAQGRFLAKSLEAKERGEEELPAAKEAPPEAPVEPKPEAAKPDEGGDPILPPRSMARADHEMWRKLPREAQGWVAQRVRELETKSAQEWQQVAGVRRRYAALDEALQPYAAEIHRAGNDVVPVIRSMFEWHKALSSNPQDAIQQLADMYNVTSLDLSERRAPAEDPRYEEDDHSEKDDRLDRIESFFTNMVKSQLQSEVDRWKGEKDQNGDPRYPYADELEDDMARYVPGLKVANKNADNSTILRKAYQLALEDRPEIKEALEERSRKQAQQTKAETDAAKVKKAKAAAVSLKGSGAAPAQSTKGMNTRELLSGMLDGHIEP